MATLPLKKSEGHFIITAGGENYIIDTGASVSCSCYGQTEVVIGDRKFRVYPLPFERVGEKISELVGLTPQTLLRGFQRHEGISPNVYRQLHRK